MRPRVCCVMDEATGSRPKKPRHNNKRQLRTGRGLVVENTGLGSFHLAPSFLPLSHSKNWLTHSQLALRSLR